MYTYRTIIFRCYPTKKQKEDFNLNFDLCRSMYNLILEHEYKLYNNYLKNKNNYTCSNDYFNSNKRKSIAVLKKEDPNYALADSIALEYEEKNVFMAFKKYFTTYAKLPKFKNYKDSNSYTTRNKKDNIRIENNCIRLPKIGFVKIKNHYDKYIHMHICTAKIIDQKNGKYFIHLTFREETKKQTIFSKPTTFNTIGLDFKIGSVFMSSDNFIPEYDSPYHKNFKRLRMLEKILKRKRKNSNSYKTVLKKIRNTHKKIVNIRRDFLHKLSSKLCKEYNYVIIESLNLKDIAKKLLNGTNTYDTSYGTFTDMLKYKVKDKVIAINKWYPSTKTCSNCNHKKSHMKLSQRTYTCNYCGLVIDRDLNAAINIKTEGLRVLNTQTITL